MTLEFLACALRPITDACGFRPQFRIVEQFFHVAHPVRPLAESFARDGPAGPSAPEPLLGSVAKIRTAAAAQGAGLTTGLPASLAPRPVRLFIPLIVGRVGRLFVRLAVVRVIITLRLLPLLRLPWLSALPLLSAASLLLPLLLSTTLLPLLPASLLLLLLGLSTWLTLFSVLSLLALLTLLFTLAGLFPLLALLTFSSLLAGWSSQSVTLLLLLPRPGRRPSLLCLAGTLTGGVLLALLTRLTKRANHFGLIEGIGRRLVFRPGIAGSAAVALLSSRGRGALSC